MADEWTAEEIKRSRKIESDLFDLANEYLIAHYGTGTPWRGDESEADLIGMELAARAGYDPRAGISLWQKMSAAAQGAPPQWLSTHPASTTRIADMKKQMDRVLPLYARATGQSLQSLKTYDSNLKHVRSSLIGAPPPAQAPAAQW